MIEEYAEQFRKEGGEFLAAARGGLRRPELFTSVIMYNILSMAIEKFFMAALMSHGDMADNHTFTDLINSARRSCPLDERLERGLFEAESYQNLCPAFDGYMRKEIPRDSILKMLDLAEEVRLWADCTIGGNQRSTVCI